MQELTPEEIEDFKDKTAEQEVCIDSDLRYEFLIQDALSGFDESE